MRGSLGCPEGQRRGSVSQGEADPVPDALIVQDPRQAGLAAAGQDVALFEHA